MFTPTVRPWQKCAIVGVAALALSACGDSKNNNDEKPNPGPVTTTSLTLAKTELAKSGTNNQALTLGSVQLADVTINGQPATSAQFNQVNMSINGTNASLFTLTKTDDAASVVFNSQSNALAAGVCANNVCQATLSAAFGDKTASVNLSVTLTYASTAPVVTSVEFDQPKLDASGNNQQAVTLPLAKVKVNGQQASASQLAAVTFALQGANKDLFAFEKTDTGVNVAFNKTGADVALGTCASNTCQASLNATLDGKTANLPLSVALTYAFNFTNDSISQTFLGKNGTVILADIKSLLRYAGKALTADQNVSLALGGTDQGVFALANNQLSYQNGTCAASPCSVTLTATLGEQTASTNASLALTEPLKIKKNPFAKVTSSYVVVPYSKDGLGESYVGGKSVDKSGGCDKAQGTSFGFCKSLVVSGDGVRGDTFDAQPPNTGIVQQSVPIFPFLLVKDDGKCIVETEGVKNCTTTVANATQAQKKAYLERVALSAEEFARLDIEITGFTASEQPLPNMVPDFDSITGPGGQSLPWKNSDLKAVLPAPSSCRGEYPCYLLRKPDASSNESDEVADAQRFKIETKATDFFTNQLEGYKQYQNNFVTAHADDLKATYNKPNTDAWQYVYSVEQEVFNSKYAGKQIPVLTVGNYQWKGIHFSDSTFLKQFNSKPGARIPPYAKLTKDAIDTHHFPPNAREIDVTDNYGKKFPMHNLMGQHYALPSIPVMLYPLDIKVASKEIADNSVDLNIKLFNVSACRGSDSQAPLLTELEDDFDPNDIDKKQAYENARANNVSLFEKSTHGYDPKIDKQGKVAYVLTAQYGSSDGYVNTKIYSNLRTNHAAPGYSFIERFWVAKKKKLQGFSFVDDTANLDPRPELAALKSKKTPKGLSPEEFELANAILNLCPSAKDVSGADGRARN